MEVTGLVEGKLVRRINRFVVEVEVDGVARAHLRDSGRLTELMRSGNRLMLKPKTGGKTDYEVYVIFDGDIPVVVNSSLHTPLAVEILQAEGFRILRREVQVGRHRIDLLVTDGVVKRLVEMKGCTLVKNGVAKFPDAPTQRGLEHLRTLKELGGMILFLVMRNDARVFTPNYETHPEFAVELESADNVEVRAAKLKPSVVDGKLVVDFDSYIPVSYRVSSG